jgi:Integrase zinc binding domain
MLFSKRPLLASPIWHLVISVAGTLRRDTRHEGHKVFYSGHFGVNKTVKSSQRFFWWPGLRADVLAYVRTCAPCQRDKPSNKPSTGLLQLLPIPTTRWEHVSVELIVELPPTAQGCNAIVVFADALSKMVYLAPTTTTATALDIAQLFLERVVCLLGLPLQIVSDRDPRFAGLF